MLDLAAHERAGGHTIARHVGKSEQELRQRLMLQPSRAAASSFVDLAEAETIVEAALTNSATVISRWLAGSGGRSGADKLILRVGGNRPFGRVLPRATGHVRMTSRLRLVLERSSMLRTGYVVMTAFPDV